VRDELQIVVGILVHMASVINNKKTTKKWASSQIPILI
jgi:hypothetical protein